METCVQSVVQSGLGGRANRISREAQRDCGCFFLFFFDGEWCRAFVVFFFFSEDFITSDMSDRATDMIRGKKKGHPSFSSRERHTPPRVVPAPRRVRACATCVRINDDGGDDER